MDRLDQLLTAAAPPTRFDVSHRDRLAVIRTARRHARDRRARVLRVSVGAGLAVALLGGGTAAAFANPDAREWFFSAVLDPYVTLQYTLPSGALCTETSGDPISNDPAAGDALRAWLSSADLMSLIDMDAALAQVRSYDGYDQSQVGSDDEYQLAVGIAVVRAAREELRRQGFPHGSIEMWKSERDCGAPAG